MNRFVALDKMKDYLQDTFSSKVKGMNINFIFSFDEKTIDECPQDKPSIFIKPVLPFERDSLFKTEIAPSSSKTIIQGKDEDAPSSLLSDVPPPPLWKKDYSILHTGTFYHERSINIPLTSSDGKPIECNPKDPLVSIARMGLSRTYIFTVEPFPNLIARAEVDYKVSRLDTFTPCQRAMLDVRKKTLELRSAIDAVPFSFASFEPQIRGCLTTRLLSFIIIIIIY